MKTYQTILKIWIITELMVFIEHLSGHPSQVSGRNWRGWVQTARRPQAQVQAQAETVPDVYQEGGAC